MAKITRKEQKVFGQNAGLNQIAEFGSLANSTPTFTTDPSVIQSLGQFTDGWFSAVIGNNSPAIEDMNALCYLYAYQLAYIMQSGVAEWDAATTYYIGSFASDGLGNLYYSATDNNLNNALTDTANWVGYNGYGSNNVNSNPYNVTVTTGRTLFYPNMTIPSGKTITVNTGGSFYSMGPVTVNGTLVINGTSRII